jgi:MFS family permease
MPIIGVRAAQSPSRAGARSVTQAKHAVSAVFVLSGFALASWAARIPQVQSGLRLSTGALGVVLLATSLGAVTALPLSGLVIARLGPVRTVRVTALVLALGLAVTAWGQTRAAPLVMLGLYLLGLGNAGCDVAMNLAGATVERRLDRVLLPRLHAGFSVGTVAGAGLGSLLVALRVPVAGHLLGVAVLVALIVPLAAGRFLPPDDDTAEPPPSRRAERVRGSASVWRERRTVLIGVVVLCASLTEGTGNDWLAAATIGGYHLSPAGGGAALTLFLAAMTVGRWFGPNLIERHGRVPALRVSALLAMGGLLVVVFGHLVVVGYLGVVAFGLGTALAFPVGMSAAADDPARAAARLSAVASIGYLGFLGGPPLIGLVGDHIGVLRSLLVTVALLALSLLALPATRPPADRSATEPAR